MCLKTLSRHSLLGGRQGDGFIWKADGNLLVSEEWVRGGMVRNASLVSFSTPCTNRRLSQGMPSEIVSAPCEPIPGTVRNVTHNNFSTFLCVCGTKRKNESENEKKKRKYPGMWFPQYHSIERDAVQEEFTTYICHQSSCILEGLPFFHRDRNHTY